MKTQTIKLEAYEGEQVTLTSSEEIIFNFLGFLFNTCNEAYIHQCIKDIDTNRTQLKNVMKQTANEMWKIAYNNK